MGPKVKFTKDQVIDAAFELAKTEGIDNITIRKIAEKMGSSVAPIYVNFKNVDELIEHLIYRIIMLSQQLIKEEDTGKPFLDIAIASIRFAKEYSLIFRDFVMKNNNYTKDYDEKMIPELIGMMREDPDLHGFTEDDLRMILLKMRIFQLGLSVMVANDLLPKNYENQELIDLISNTANDVILATRLCNNIKKY